MTFMTLNGPSNRATLQGGEQDRFRVRPARPGQTHLVSEYKMEKRDWTIVLAPLAKSFARMFVLNQAREFKATQKRSYEASSTTFCSCFCHILNFKTCSNRMGSLAFRTSKTREIGKTLCLMLIFNYDSPPMLDARTAQAWWNHTLNNSPVITEHFLLAQFFL